MTIATTSKSVIDQFGNTYKLLKCIGDGAEGAVYKTDVEGKLVKLVNISSIQIEQWIAHKKWLMRQKKEEFVSIVLPRALLVGEETGYVMDEVTNHVPLIDFIVKPNDRELHAWYNEETGGVKKRVEIAKLLARCFRNLHTHGLAFSDISPTNILVSKESKSIWIIDPDNITAPGRFDNAIIGTPRYIAPELFKESRSISSLTDTYSYGVLMFEMFRLGHPYIGDELSEAIPEEEARAFEGAYPYIDHPQDDSNRSQSHLPAQLILNDTINNLFERLFVDGQNNFMHRPTLLEFYKAFNRVDNLINVCSCGASYIMQEGAICPWCDTPASKVLLLNCVQESNVKDEGLEDGRLKKNKELRSQILLIENTWIPIYQHHFNPDVLLEDNKLIGAIIKKGNAVLYLNRSAKRREHIVIDRQTRAKENIVYDGRYVLQPRQAIVVDDLNEKQANITDVVNKATLLNYVELAIEVKL